MTKLNNAILYVQDVRTGLKFSKPWVASHEQSDFICIHQVNSYI